MNQLPFPFSLMPSFDASVARPASDLWSRVGALYGNSMQTASQELWTSSARIVQEHATRAWIESSQACLRALSENAAAVQQRAFTQLIQDNQKAGEIVTQEIGTAFNSAMHTTP